MGVNDDQRWALSLFQCGLEGAIHLREIVDIGHVLHVPVPAEEARAYVIAEGQRGVALNGDVVVVVKPDEVRESKMSGDGGGLIAHAFHQIAVAAKSVNPVVENIVAIFVELRSQPALGDGDRKSTRLNSSHL